MEGVGIKKVLVSNKISFGENNYKDFIGYLCNGNQVKPLKLNIKPLNQLNH